MMNDASPPGLVWKKGVFGRAFPDISTREKKGAYCTGLRRVAQCLAGPGCISMHTDAAPGVWDRSKSSSMSCPDSARPPDDLPGSQN